MIILETLAYGLALWLGLYLIARNAANARLRYTGLGLIAYALGLLLHALANQASTSTLALNLERIALPTFFLPAFFWFGATIHLLPDDSPLHTRLIRLWLLAIAPLTIALYGMSIGSDLIFDDVAGTLQPGSIYLVFAVAIVLLLLEIVLLVRRAKHKGSLLSTTLFFTLSSGLLLVPFDGLPRIWIVLAIGLDLILLGYAIAVLDAIEEGQSLLPDMLRSLVVSFLGALIFGGQIALALILGAGETLPLLVLMFITIGVALFIQTFSDPIQTALDRLAFARLPELTRARADLRAASTALPRLTPALDLDTLDDEEFARLTRRALSQLGDLSRLASNPLTRLPIVTQRSAQDNTLERANGLKALLAESIARLKPRDKGDFGTADEWRHYNALYFPYIIGLRPYSRRANHDGLDAAAQAALDWFRADVPERTLHNWQNIAARLIAQDLRDRSRVIQPPSSNWHYMAAFFVDVAAL